MYRSGRKFRMRKAAVGKERKKPRQSQHGKLEKVKSRKEVNLEAQRDKKGSPLCYIEICHLKTAVRTNITKLQRQSRAPWWHCKDDSGAIAVFAGSSASQMTAATVMDVIARLPEGYVFHDTKWAQIMGKHWRSLWYLSNKILDGHTLAGLLWERQIEEVLLELGLEKTN